MAASGITCVFHTSPSITGLLNSPAGQSLAGDLLIECALTPGLAFPLNLETPANYPGIVGLLGGVEVASLAHSFERLPAPIVLAPGTTSAPATIRAALALLPGADHSRQNLTLLVPVGYAPALGAALAVASQFILAWDVCEFPHEEVVEFARWLGREQLIDRGNFQGVIAYASQPVEAAHTHRITGLLGPLATSRHPAGVIALAG